MYIYLLLINIRENSLLDRNGLCSDPTALAEKMKSKLSEIVESEDIDAFAYSQPTDLRLDRDSGELMDESMGHSRGGYDGGRIISFSQPTSHFAEKDLFPIPVRQESVCMKA